MSDPNEPTEDPLAVHRDTIDRIDRELVDLLSQRAKAATAIGAAKKASGGAVFVPHREQAVYDKVCALNKGPLPDSCLRAIWREIMSGSINLEQCIRICHFGKAGAFTHQAARLKFGDSVDYASIESIAGVFQKVEQGQADYGVVPIENSTDGGINDTIDVFLSTKLMIVSEMKLRIRHHLMGNLAQGDIKRVCSKDTVFRQCRNWLAANLPGVELIEVGSTTLAADRAAVEEGTAAIASAEAADAKGLPLINSDIQDNPTNTTRFVVVADANKVAKPSGNDKTSLMFGVQDRPGALYDALIPFHQSGISLSRIESRPSRRQAWEYLFFIDLEGHIEDPKLKSALDELAKHTGILQVLGSYPRAEHALNG